MGISFKVSKSGKRFHPKLPPAGAASFPVDREKPDDVVAGSSKKRDGILLSSRNLAGEASDSKGIAEISENEVSFCLNLFPDGYSVTKLMKGGSGRETSVDVSKYLHPYDRASETMFSIRDYRKCVSEVLNNVGSGNSSPLITRVRLRMSLENVVKDIPTISDNDWTYGDLMEVESRILKALQPQLSLHPTPQLDKLSDNPGPRKLNFELRSMRRKRLAQIPQVAVTSNNRHGKKVCLERAPESSRSGNPGSLSLQIAYENSNIQNPNSMLQLRNNSFGSDSSLNSSF